MWARKAKKSLVGIGAVGLLWLEGCGHVRVCDRIVVCIVECCGGRNWGVVEKGGMLMVSLTCVLVGSRWGKGLLFESVVSCHARRMSGMSICWRRAGCK